MEKWGREKTKNKVVDINPNISIIITNIKETKVLTERQRLSEWTFKKHSFLTYIKYIPKNMKTQ